MGLEGFHEATQAWFARALGEPTEPQRAAWPRILEGESTLVLAPTGSGKTLAAFLSALDALVREGLRGTLADETRVLYVSPLRALGNDVEKNVKIPLSGIAHELEALGLPAVPVRTQVRSGDTPSRERARMALRPPHVLVTTPESLYVLLTSESGRRMLGTVRSVIVDEIHALVGDKRGSHLALSLARLDALVGRHVQRVGLSATQKSAPPVARFLVGRDLSGAERPCAIVDAGHRRPRDVAIELPGSPLEAVMAGEVWSEVYDRLASLVREHRTTLVFVNTRRTAERVTRCLAERLGAEFVAAHHGSLSREHRLLAEERLKSGALRALVATASLELGIDIGTVDLVCQVGATRSIGSFLQRVGRAAHHKEGVSKGRLFPLSRDELVECIALVHATLHGELDEVSIPVAPLDILGQQLVAAAASGEWDEAELFGLVRTAEPYRDLSRSQFDAVLEMLALGFTTRRGRRAARLHRDTVGGTVRARKGSRLIAMTSGGAIPDNADYDVVLEPGGQRVGSINEDFAIESMAGDVFQLGNTSWKIVRVEPGAVRVEDARGQAPTIPFWLGEAPARTPELSRAVSRIRAGVDEALGRGVGDLGAAERWLECTVGVSPAVASQAALYLAAGRNALSAMPTTDTLVLERFFDDSGGMQLVVHSPMGSRVNRAWGLALRKRFCQRFDFELQAAATDDAIVLSLGPTHSFPLEEVFQYLRADTARELLVQAVLVAPMFTTRWRWNATRSLAVLRFRGGRKVPPRLQRMEAEDLAAVVFPDQVACQDNLPGKREIPDHPLVEQTLRDCLVEAMDIEGLLALLTDITAGRKRLVARDTTEPSPFAREILTARPYAFLDDAPLEERRTRAVQARRWLDPRSAAELGALDAEAITRVRREAWPEVQSPDELWEALHLLGYMTEAEGLSRGLEPHFEVLLASGRAVRHGVKSGPSLWSSVQRYPEVKAALGEGSAEGPLPPEAARIEVLRGRLEALGPVRATGLARESGLPVAEVQVVLSALEAEGFLLRGEFTPGVQAVAKDPEFCERGLLARIHRYTLGRLRSEIEPVSRADYLRFLLAWQRVSPGHRVSGPEGLLSVLAQLEGFAAPAAAWEGEILPARVEGYDPAWLDALCLSGRVVWCRAPRTPAVGEGSSGPIRATPIVLLLRDALEARPAGAGREVSVTPAAERIRAVLAARGATFFDELVRGAGLVRAEAEAGLGELVAQGLVTSDSFAGLRALLVPAAARARGPHARRRAPLLGMEAAGRWSLLPGAPDAGRGAEEQAERVARALLRRYGIVVRCIASRDAASVPFRDLLRIYRRLEASAEIRGGRFVAGFTGEQYALPEAVAPLRSARRSSGSAELVAVSAADPLNLVGLVLPGERVPSITKNRLLYRDGAVVARKVGGRVELSPETERAERWQLESALIRRLVPPGLRPYLGSSA